MKVVQYFEGPIPYIYQYCIADVKAKIPKSVEYTIIDKMPDEYKNAGEGYPMPVRRWTVEQRLNLLVEDPDRIWIDTDVLCDVWPDFTFLPGKPYVFNKTCGLAVIYANGCKEAMQNLLTEYKKKNGEMCACKIINANPNDYYKIPDGYFQHLMLGKIMGAKGNIVRAKNDHCSIINVNGEKRFESIVGRIL